MRSILIIDASYLTRLVYRCFFTGNGYSIWDAFTYVDVVAIIEKNNMDLIILDMDFLDSNDVSGDQVYRFLREERWIKVPMIILYGEWLTEPGLRSANNYRDKWIRKPVDLMQMRKEIEAII